MTLIELKGYLNGLPDEFNEFLLMNGEFGILDPEGENSLTYRLDKPISTVYVDKKTKEICLLHETEEEVSSFINPKDNGTSETAQ